MGTATHLGPWLLGTVKYTTGTTAGTVRNVGATTVSQTVTLVAGSAVTVMIPAGSMITAIASYMTTGQTGTPNVTIGGTVVGTVSTAAGVNSLVATTGAQAAVLLNVGTTDALLSYTATAASAGVLLVEYSVRNPDGTYFPTSYTGP